MSIGGSNSHLFGVYMAPGYPQTFVVHAPDGQKVCKFTMTLWEHPQVIGGWLVSVESTPDDAGRITTQIKNKNLYWTDGDGDEDEK